jgi:hypothetical protein
MCSHLGFTVQVTSTMTFALRMKSRFKLRAMITAFGTLAGLIATGCGTVRAGYESAPYKVVRSDGQFELRDYPVLTVVETPMARDSNGSGGSFNRLFRFITGGNEANQKISMTTARLHVWRRHQCDNGLCDPGEDENRGSAQAIGSLGDRARIAGGPVCGAALQRRAQCEERGGGAGAIAGVDEARGVEGIVVASLWLLRPTLDTGLPAPQRSDGTH